MTNWRIGLSTGCFYKRNILECLEPIRESGFSTIEVCSSPAHLDFHDEKLLRRAEERITKLGMEAYSFHAPFAPDIDIASPSAARRKHAVKEISKAAKAAALLRAHYFVLHPGPEHPPSVSGEEQLLRMQHVIESINEIARCCHELGVICVLENKLPHLLFGKTTDILWILDGIDSAEVGACLDTGHGFLGGDLHHLVQKLASYLKMIHAHDNSASGDEHLPPGDGKINWPQLLQDLVGIGFHGAIMLEIGEAADLPKTLENARRGRSFLRHLARRLKEPA